jgi:phage terminase small subunit
MNDLATASPRSTPAKARKDQVVARLCRRVFRVCDYLKEADRPAVRAWAELEVLAGMAYAKLRDEGLLRDDGSGEAKTLVDVFQRLRKTQLSFAREIGLTPRARAEIAADSHYVPVDLESAAAERIERLPEERADEA